MMRFQAAICSGLAALLVAPGTLIGRGELRVLEEALSDTTRALKILTGLQKEDARELTPDLAMSVTEPPMLDERERDDRLSALRNEVNLLQMEFDALEGPTPAMGAPVVPADDRQPPDGTALMQRLTTGLDDGLKNALRASRPERTVGRNTRPETSVEKPEEGAAASAEPDGYSADPVLEARACYFAGKYDRGLTLVEALPEDSRALYWKARILERLERFDEAITTLERVIVLAGQGFEAEKAKADLEFLQWKRGFLQRISSDAGKSGGGSR